MDKRRLIERMLVLCSRKAHTASMLREALGVSAGPLLTELARAGRLQRQQLNRANYSAWNRVLYWYETTPAGARHALALIRERKDEEAEGMAA